MIVRERIKKTDGSIKYRQYLKQNRLGKGGFAECFQVQRIGDKKKYALKIVSKKLLQKPKARQKMLSQIKLHQGCKHRNICQLQRVFEDQDFVYMLLQLCNHGNMFQMIKRRKKLTIPQTQFFIYQLIDSLCYLHNRQMIHRDVKLGNLLIDADMNLKLADFGLTTKIQFAGDRKHTVCGTPNYIAPEIIRSSMGYGASGHSYEVDVWSTGIIMYLMLIGKAPFQTTVVEKTYQKIAKGQFEFPDSFKDESAKDLLRKILVVDPCKRYTFAQILSHSFMNPKQGIPKELPQVSYSQVPKFGVFEKYAQDSVKQSARSASVVTLRSTLDLSIDQDMSGLNSSKGIESNRSSSKDRKGLLKSIFSTDTISNTINKLTNLGRSPSPQNKVIQPRLNRSSSNIGRSKSKQGFRANTTFIEKTQKIQKQEQKKKQLGFVYVLDYRQDVVWNYILSNGYIGTYEPNYKIVFNKHDGIYFEVDDKGVLKKIKRGEEIMNENIVNRKKFIKQYKDHPLECEPFTSSSRVVYIVRIYKVQTQNLILFKLSNQHIQAYHLKKNIHLLLTNEDLIMVEIENGRQISRFVQKKENYAKCSTKMLDLYLVVKKILLKISNAKKNTK